MRRLRFGLLFDFRNQIFVGIDDVVEEVDAVANEFSEAFPIDSASRVYLGIVVAREIIKDHRAEIDRAEIAGIIRRQRLFAAGIGGFDDFIARIRREVVHTIDIDDSRFTGLPSVFDDGTEYFGRRLGNDLAVDGVRFAGTRIKQRVVAVLFNGAHKLISDGDGDIEVGDLGEIILARDKFLDIRMVDTQDAHIGATASSCPASPPR